VQFGFSLRTSLSGKSVSSPSRCNLSVLCVSVVSVSVSNFTTETQRTLRLHRGNGNQIFSRQTASQAKVIRFWIRVSKLHLIAMTLSPVITGSLLIIECCPGVPLRSTPEGFMLTPAPLRLIPFLKCSHPE